MSDSAPIPQIPDNSNPESSSANVLPESSEETAVNSLVIFLFI